MSEERARFPTLERVLRWGFYGWVNDIPAMDMSAIAGFIVTDKREQLDNKKTVRRAPPAVPLSRPRGKKDAGQAGMIMSYVARQPRLEQAHLVAKYLFGPERTRARQILARYVFRRVKNDWITIPLAKTLVAEYYGRPHNDALLLEKHEIGKQRLQTARSKVHMALDPVSARAEDTATEYFRAERLLA